MPRLTLKNPSQVKHTNYVNLSQGASGHNSDQRTLDFVLIPTRSISFVPTLFHAKCRGNLAAHA